MKIDLQRWEAALVAAMRRANYIGTRRLPPGVRSIVGLLFIVGGIFGFLPVLGFWMIPLGIFFIALEIPAWRRPIRRWLNLRKKRLNGRAASGRDDS